MLAETSSTTTSGAPGGGGPASSSTARRRRRSAHQGAAAARRRSNPGETAGAPRGGPPPTARERRADRNRAAATIVEREHHQHRDGGERRRRGQVGGHLNLMPCASSPAYQTGNARDSAGDERGEIGAGACSAYGNASARRPRQVPRRSRHLASSGRYATSAVGPSGWSRPTRRRPSTPRGEAPGRVELPRPRRRSTVDRSAAPYTPARRARRRRSVIRSRDQERRAGLRDGVARTPRTPRRAAPPATSDFASRSAIATALRTLR